MAVTKQSSSLKAWLPSAATAEGKSGRRSCPSGDEHDSHPDRTWSGKGGGRHDKTSRETSN